MTRRHPLPATLGVSLALALSVPGAVLAYDNRDAAHACESRIRSEYGLTDLRDIRAVQLPGEKRYRVEGQAKVDGDKYPWSCEIEDRRVVETNYDGRRPRSFDDGGRGRTPEVVQRRSGDLEVRMPSGCTALYDRDGTLINRGSRCSASDRRQAEDAVDSYLREQGSSGDRGREGYRDERYDGRHGKSYGNREDDGRDEYEDGRRGGYERPQDGPPPEIIAGTNGEAEVIFKNDCVVYYDSRGRRRDASPRCNDRQIDKADQSLRTYRREQGF